MLREPFYHCFSSLRQIGATQGQSSAETLKEIAEFNANRGKRFQAPDVLRAVGQGVWAVRNRFQIVL